MGVGCLLYTSKHTLHSNNLYQIFTYVKNRSYQFGEEDNTVSGMLLYAKTEEEIQPDNVYQMRGSQISVKTLDLNLPFVEIAAQMDRIVESHFTGVIKADTASLSVSENISKLRQHRCNKNHK